MSAPKVTVVVGFADQLVYTGQDVLPADPLADAVDAPYSPVDALELALKLLNASVADNTFLKVEAKGALKMVVLLDGRPLIRLGGEDDTSAAAMKASITGLEVVLDRIKNGGPERDTIAFGKVTDLPS